MYRYCRNVEIFGSPNQNLSNTALYHTFNCTPVLISCFLCNILPTFCQMFGLLFYTILQYECECVCRNFCNFMLHNLHTQQHTQHAHRKMKTKTPDSWTLGCGMTHEEEKNLQGYPVFNISMI